MFLPILYSEVHYGFRYLLPLYHKTEPEIIFDIPRQVLLTRSGNKIPIFLLIKDADKYPVNIENISIHVFCKKKHYKYCILKKIQCYDKIQYFEFPINIAEQWINEYLTIYINFQANSIKYRNDNYFSDTPHNFKVFISDKTSLFRKNWFIGDVHYHSVYTSDQVEFGAPIGMTKKIARTMGLDWFFVTDHSYDLDDYDDDFLKNDPKLLKWEALKAECAKLSSDRIKIIFGEEVSVGNSKNENVHLLVVNQSEFIHGSGDSAENWFNNKPELKLKDIKADGLLVAAHPFEKIPYIQEKLLNRGNWSETDLKDAKIKYIQIINGKSFKENLLLINKYFRLLLNGNKYFILAGNDAHGNFQFMKQISVPFMKLMCKKYQLFAEYFTAFHYHENNPIEGIKNNQIVISNGPYVNFTIKNKQKEHNIGEIIKLNKECDLLFYYEYRIDKIHGEISEICLIYGDLIEKKIKRIDLIDKFHVTNNSFFCFMLKTKERYLALTNPIWIEINIKEDK